MNMAVHMRISGVTVSDDDVNSRAGAASALATSWGKVKIISDILAKAEDIAKSLNGDGTPSSALGNEVQGAIQKRSSSYLYEERPLDVGICAGVAMVSTLSARPKESGWLVSDVYAAALWSALAYQAPLMEARREKLRREVLDAAADRSTAGAEIARERKIVPDPAAVTITVDEDNAFSHNIAESMATTIEALRTNAALDREELDFLWWAQLAHSRLLKKRLSAIAEPVRIIAAGIEGAKMLRRLPCEVHREIILRTIDQDPELDLTELLAVIGEDRAALSSTFSDTHVSAHPTIFPLLHALLTGRAEGSDSSIKRHASEWGERALLEAGFVQIIAHSQIKL